MEAIVDTGCTRSLITQAALERVGISNLVQSTSDDIVTINGEPLATIGCDNLVLHEDDDLVHLPTIVVSLQVVDRRDALSTDVAVGSDVISKQGSLHLCYDSSKVNPLNATGLCMPGTAHIFFKIFKLIFHANFCFACLLLGLHGPYNFVVLKINL